jgi:hypothetical protein
VSLVRVYPKIFELLVEKIGVGALGDENNGERVKKYVSLCYKTLFYGKL